MIFSGERGRRSVLIKFGKKSICSGTEVKERVVENYTLELQLAEQYVGAGRRRGKVVLKSHRSSTTSHRLLSLYPILGTCSV